MCGRYAQRTDPKKLAKEFKVAEVPNVEPRYNIAPTQDILAVYDSSGGREMTFYKWGLIPSWAKDASMGAVGGRWRQGYQLLRRPDHGG